MELDYYRLCFFQGRSVLLAKANYCHRSTEWLSIKTIYKGGQYMNCVICGKEHAIYSVMGLNGTVCQECNDYLFKLNHGKAAEAKYYFDSVTKGNNLDTSTSRFLEVELRKHRSEIEEFEPFTIQKETISSTISTEKQSSERKNNKPVEKHFIQQPTMQHTSELKEIKNLIEEQNQKLQTIKSILVFFAVVVSIGIVGSLIYIIQLVSMFKNFV